MYQNAVCLATLANYAICLHTSYNYTTLNTSETASHYSLPNNPVNTVFSWRRLGVAEDDAIELSRKDRIYNRSSALKSNFI